MIDYGTSEGNGATHAGRLKHNISVTEFLSKLDLKLSELGEALGALEKNLVLVLREDTPVTSAQGGDKTEPSNLSPLERALLEKGDHTRRLVDKVHNLNRRLSL